MEIPPPVPSKPPGLREGLLLRVRGLGPGRAKRLVERFGDGLDDALGKNFDAEALAAAIDPARPSLARRIAAELAARWRKELRPEFESLSWLEAHGLGDTPGLARRIVRILGEKTRATLEANPYVLAKTLPWPRMDPLGLRVLGARMGAKAALDAPQRLLGALDALVGELMAQGHTAALPDLLLRRLQARLGSKEKAKEAGRLGLRHGRLRHGDGLLRFAGCAFLEDEVAAGIDAMGTAPGAIAPDEEAARGALRRIEGLLPRPLSEEQRDAVVFCLLRPFSVLSGGAGTGKTATMQALVLAWEELGGRVHLCALAGKAALRLGQSTQRRAKTLHRSLDELGRRRKAETKGTPTPPEWTFLDDTTLVVVDEASMVDLGQWARLFAALPEGCRLLMVGDTGQLPPIGFGLVFHLLAQRPASATLTRIFRQAEGSGIPAAAAAIRERRPLVLPPFQGPAEGAFRLECAEEELEDQIVEAAEALGGFGPTGLSLHVVAATNRRVDSLNQRFHEARRGQKPELRTLRGTRLSSMDPVVCLENDYARGLYNGLLGTVLSVDVGARRVVASFEGKIQVFAGEDLLKLALAYALTCHKLQGSQAPRILVAVEPSGLVEPSWLYTAITRAEDQAVLVGDENVLADALARKASWAGREVGFQPPRPEGTSSMRPGLANVSTGTPSS